MPAPGHIKKYLLNPLGKLISVSPTGDWVFTSFDKVLPKDEKGKFLQHNGIIIDGNYVSHHSTQLPNVVPLPIKGDTKNFILYTFKHPVTKQDFQFGQLAPPDVLPPSPKEMDEVDEEEQEPEDQEPEGQEPEGQGQEPDEEEQEPEPQGQARQSFGLMLVKVAGKIAFR